MQQWRYPKPTPLMAICLPAMLTHAGDTGYQAQFRRSNPSGITQREAGPLSMSERWQRSTPKRRISA